MPDLRPQKEVAPDGSDYLSEAASGPTPLPTANQEVTTSNALTLALSYHSSRSAVAGST